LSVNSEIREIKTAVILGAGNVAWHFGHSLSENGIRIVQVCNRTDSKGKALAESLGAQYINKPEETDKNADLLILALSDDVIGSVACSLGFIKNSILVHTAGSVPMDILAVSATNSGVIYPLQTFSAARQVDFRQVPLLLEANNTIVLDSLSTLASRLSQRVYAVNSENRMKLHLAAVLSSNFTNHLLFLSEKLLADQDLPFDLLKALMFETVSKAFESGPEGAQTGPAIRGNNKVIEKHLRLLEKHPEISNVYKVLSDSISRLVKL